MQTLDVRLIAPRLRRGTIVECLDALATGESLRLLDDHDPALLHHLLDATRPDQFRWEYVASGPEEWSVDITSTALVVDARPTLGARGARFAEIMDAAGHVDDDEVLVVYAPFEPVPLEGVLGALGFRYVADRLDSGDWRVTFQLG